MGIMPKEGRTVNTMRKLLFVTAILALAAPAALAQQLTDFHTVTVNVVAMDNIDVQNDVVLDIVFDPVTGNGIATDNSAILAWVTNQADRKVTVATNVNAPAYPLSVIPAGIVATVGANPGVYCAGPGALNLDAAAGAVDFIDTISASGGQTNLIYTATATVGDPLGQEIHTVTYTIEAM